MQGIRLDNYGDLADLEKEQNQVVEDSRVVRHVAFQKLNLSHLQTIKNVFQKVHISCCCAGFPDHLHVLP